MSVLMLNDNGDPHPQVDTSKGRGPWVRLLLVMTVPVLLLLVGISLTR